MGVVPEQVVHVVPAALQAPSRQKPEQQAKAVCVVQAVPLGWHAQTRLPLAFVVDVC
jgi:hypothetical protein